jgi:hypothetical protein
MGRVTGRVLGDDGQPIPKSSVQLLQHVSDADTKIVFYAAGASVPFAVEADGTFTLDELVPEVSYNVNVSAPGHASAFGTPFAGPSGTAHHLPDIILPRADQTIVGIVVDACGKPLPGVGVYGTPVRSGGIEHSVRISGGHVFTDNDGRFRLVGIPRGPVRLSAYLNPTDPQLERVIRTHGTRMVEAGQQDVRLVLAGPDVQRTPEAVVGKPAPGFPVQQWVQNGDIGPSAFDGGAYRGRTVLLVFMDEAGPSKRILERLNEIHEKNRDKGLAIVRVYESLPSESKTRSAVSAAVVPPGLVAGGYSEAFQKYGVRATPTLFLIDPTGILRHADPDPDKLDSLLADLLKR